MADLTLVEEENEEKPAENPKRKVEKTVLDNFSKLVNPHEQVRIKSGVNLLKHLSEKDENQEDSNELKYALKRLVRGLGSSTSTARIGYFSTLVGILNIDDTISVSEILSLVKAELHKSGKNSDGENADILIGQILTCGAIIKSNLWKKCDQLEKKQIIDIILNANKERTYLGVIGNSFLIHLFDQIHETELDKLILPSIQPEIEKPWREQSLDTLYMLLTLKNKFPKIYKGKHIEKFLETPDIVCEESLHYLSNILMAIPRVTSIKHPVYDEIVNHLNSQNVYNFFTQLDNHLRNPNRNRLLVFIKVLTNTYLQILTKNDETFFEQIPEILMPNFIRQVIAYFQTLTGKTRDKQYREAIDKLFEAIINVLKLENVQSKTKIAVLKKLLFKPGTFIFEKRTKSKIIQQITMTLDSKGVKKLAKVYKGVTEGTEKIHNDENWLNNDRLYAAHLLIKLLGHPNMKTENDWKVDQLSFLMTSALLREQNGISIGRELADSLKTAFFGALDLKLSKLDELHSILHKLVDILNSKINPEGLETVLRNPIQLETYELFQKTLNVVEKIEKKKNKKRGLKSVFLTMFLHMSLQLFNDVKLATESLNELHTCYKRIKQDKKTRHNFDETQNMTLNSTQLTEQTSNDPHWIEVVTDLFLNLLSHNSHLLRSVINYVFPHLCDHMTSNTIHQIVSVLDPENEDPLSKEGDDDDDEEEDEDEEESTEDSDEDTGNENDVDDNGSSEDSDDEDDKEENVNDQLRMALHQAMMKVSKNDEKNGESDEESVDLDQMSDAEGENLDKVLSEAFKKFKPNQGRKKKQSKDQETLTHFRVRVLDLVEIYLDSNPSMLLALEIMLPLLKSVEFSIRDQYQKPLNDRLKSVLKKLLGLKKFSEIEGVTNEVLVDLLKSLLDKGTKNVIIIQDMGEQISDCCLFIVKCSEILNTNESVTKKEKKHLRHAILEVLSGEIHSFFTRRDCLTPYVLFKNILQISWEGNTFIVPTLLEFLFSDEVKQFKKNQVAELLKIFYSNQRFLKRFKEKVEKKLNEYHAVFFEKITQLFKELCENPDNKQIKERFVCNIFNLLHSMKHSGLDFNIAWKEIGEIIREYRSHKSLSKDAKIAFNKLCSSIGVSNIVKMKNNVSKVADNQTVEDANIDEDTDKKSKKEKRKQKRKLSKEKLKLKKESKKLRLEGLSEGYLEETGREVHPESINHKNINEKTHLTNGHSTVVDEEIVGNGVEEKNWNKKRHTMGDVSTSTTQKKRKISV